MNVPLVTGMHGDLVNIPVIFEEVDNLAGIKPALKYVTNILKFVKEERTAYTANMLHVVNDRIPGKLIIAMASAKELTGENIALVEISLS